MVSAMVMPTYRSSCPSAFETRSGDHVISSSLILPFDRNSVGAP